MSNIISRVKEQLRYVAKYANDENKKTGFIIGNTAKCSIVQPYSVPLRNTSLMVTGGVIVYSERDAVEIAKLVDGKVDYVLVDAEKKIADADSRTGEPGNIERAVREHVQFSKLWTFKGNDLSVEAVDALLTKLYNSCERGLGGKKIAIIGCGNLGSKLALKLVERGANVFITRRDQYKLTQLESALNIIKPIYTTTQVVACQDNEQACKGVDIVIGASQGTPVISAKMIKLLSPNEIVVDVGKGSICNDAITMAHAYQISVYRLDISCAIAGVIAKLIMMDELFEKSMGRKEYNGYYLVSGGVMGKRGDIVVNSISQPTEIYGVADGVGDFLKQDNKLTIMDLDTENLRKEEVEMSI